MKEYYSNKIVSVVLGTYNRLKILKITIECVRTQLIDFGYKSEIIIIDGGSTDGTLKWLTKQKDIITVTQHNRGVWRGKEIDRRSWGYFINLGFKIAQGKYVCMISDDCILRKGCIKNGIDLFEKKIKSNEKVGAIAFYWRNWPEQTKYNVGMTLGCKMFVNHGLYLKKVLEKIGYIDENSFNFYHADGDLCLKIWDSGYSCIDSPNSFVDHYSHANLGVRMSNNVYQKKDWNSYIQKWKGKFVFDKKDDYFGGWKERGGENEVDDDVFVKKLAFYHIVNQINIIRSKIIDKVTNIQL
jgi:glycosyltransferase involved in cell wall biosynthesis